jgi:hypothetical protein
MTCLHRGWYSNGMSDDRASGHPITLLGSRRTYRWAWLLLLWVAPWPLSAGSEFSDPEPVVILGYAGDAMEPFISRDDRYLLFNNRNDPATNTDLFWAKNIDGKTFQFQGAIQDVNTPALEGVASLDRGGELYFISPRSYERTLSTVYHGHFDEGRVARVDLVQGLTASRRGVVIFDAEISADGQRLYGVEGDLTGGPVPKWSRLFLAERKGGGGFERLAEGDRILASLNQGAIQYAPCISVDGREIFFTRLSGVLLWRHTQILHATRASTSVPFGPPEPLESITGFVEGPSLSGDGRRLYFHKREGEHFRIWRVTRVSDGTP